MRTTVSKVVIVSGNGGGDVRRGNWYAAVERALAAHFKDSVRVILPQMPQSELAPESVWVSFLLNELGCDESTVLIGHSSGAEAGMRLAEKNKLHTLVVVSACHTDLGDEWEAKSGYYGRPWLWDDIKKNVANEIIQLGSADDPLVPFESEQLHVHKMLDSKLTRFEDRGHFCQGKFPELVEIVKSIK